MLLGQTTAVIDYDFAVRNGLQESEVEVSEYGIQVNRAFGAADTIIYVPILVASFIGFWLRDLGICDNLRSFQIMDSLVF